MPLDLPPLVPLLQSVMEERFNYKVSKHLVTDTSLLKISINPIALRKAKIVCNFGFSECNRVNEM